MEAGRNSSSDSLPASIILHTCSYSLCACNRTSSPSPLLSPEIRPCLHKHRNAIAKLVFLPARRIRMPRVLIEILDRLARLIGVDDKGNEHLRHGIVDVCDNVLHFPILWDGGNNSLNILGHLLIESEQLMGGGDQRLMIGHRHLTQQVVERPSSSIRNDRIEILGAVNDLRDSAELVELHFDIPAIDVHDEALPLGHIRCMADIQHGLQVVALEALRNGQVVDIGKACQLIIEHRLARRNVSGREQVDAPAILIVAYDMGIHVGTDELEDERPVRPITAQIRVAMPSVLQIIDPLVDERQRLIGLGVERTRHRSQPMRRPEDIAVLAHPLHLHERSIHLVGDLHLVGALDGGGYFLDRVVLTLAEIAKLVEGQRDDLVIDDIQDDRTHLAEYAVEHLPHVPAEPPRGALGIVARSEHGIGHHALVVVAQKNEPIALGRLHGARQHDQIERGRVLVGAVMGHVERMRVAGYDDVAFAETEGELIGVTKLNGIPIVFHIGEAVVVEIVERYARCACDLLDDAVDGRRTRRCDEETSADSVRRSAISRQLLCNSAAAERSGDLVDSLQKIYGLVVIRLVHSCGLSSCFAHWADDSECRG